MSTREWCDRCNCVRPFEPHDTSPYVISCAMCGHGMVERTRPARRGTSWLEQSQPAGDR